MLGAGGRELARRIRKPQQESRFELGSGRGCGGETSGLIRVVSEVQSIVADKGEEGITDDLEISVWDNQGDIDFIY